ncbi:RNA-binding protein [Synechococcus sp. KORDI-100]|uniref:RNA recognition motif domain-containing protein n=1 Tax=Synechococcus sp. KORDI-100 TaxID=1280380 RepID=UPI0004E04193|nr:RNA-binding protein [Synechococcus sp. KORDI-100]AII41961.1 RNA-binding protein [Synechococcus sp. KORDI-100]
MSIFVGNLPFRAEQEDVIELFAQFGEVVNCALPLERDTGRKRGFAFIEMSDESVESAAIEALQGAELMGRPLRINKAEPRGSAPRRGGGGYGGGGSGGYGGGGGGGYGGGGGGYRGGGGGYGGGGGGYGGGGGQDGERRSGARGWEDRSYGARDNRDSSGDGGYDDGRSRRRRGSSTAGGDDYSGYGGAEG